MKKLISIIVVMILCINITSVRLLATETNEEKKAESQKQQAKTTESDSVETVADTLGLTARSAVLMEGSTGELLYEKEKDVKVNPASITKIMTMILIFEALQEGRIHLTDEVTVSEHAASMGGSQVFLEPNEKQTVEVMIKCISIASANDACVAMAEKIGGSEEEFVANMNKRAKELGMKNTNFVNCCGLDVDNHYTTAYDVALMSRELITKHPEVSKYATTWMDEFTHTTKKGDSVFGLTNTNKLVRFYDGITGLKTGSTSKAKYCLSATAKRNNMDLIAVIMSAPAPKDRFSEASKLLDYGFANCSIYKDDNKDLNLANIPVENGVSEFVPGAVKSQFSYICLKDVNPAEITKQATFTEHLVAPVKKGNVIGKVTYFYNGAEIGHVDIVANEDVRKVTFKDAYWKAMKKFFLKAE